MLGQVFACPLGCEASNAGLRYGYKYVNLHPGEYSTNSTSSDHTDGGSVGLGHDMPGEWLLIRPAASSHPSSSFSTSERVWTWAARASYSSARSLRALTARASIIVRAPSFDTDRRVRAIRQGPLYGSILIIDPHRSYNKHVSVGEVERPRRHRSAQKRVGACVDGPLDARGKMRILTGGSIAIMCPAC